MAGYWEKSELPQTGPRPLHAVGPSCPKSKLDDYIVYQETIGQQMITENHDPEAADRDQHYTDDGHLSAAPHHP